MRQIAYEPQQQATTQATTQDVNTDKGAVNALGPRLRTMFNQAEIERRDQELQWAKNLRQYRGDYEPSVKIKLKANRSKAYLNLTRIKVRALDARLLDMLFPGGTEKNWAIEPTPVPEMDQVTAARAAQAITENIGVMPEATDIKDVLKEYAKQACEKMSETIEDQLTEGKYKRKCRHVFHSGHIFGTGCLKGPLSQLSRDPQWKESIEKPGEYERKFNEVEKPYFDNTRVWDIYPDMSAVSVDEMDYLFERHVMSRMDLRELSHRSDFDTEVIRQHIITHPEGDATRKLWEEEVKAINDKLAAVIDLKRKYEVLEAWVYLDGADLVDWMGLELDEGELDQEFLANVWILGDTIIKADLMPPSVTRIPYNFYYYEKDDTSIWGIGAPETMSDGQDLVNSSNRAMIDNAALSSGPMFEANTDLMHPDENPDDIHPWRMFKRKGRGAEAQFPAIRVYTIPNNTAQLSALVKFFKEFTDEVSNIPSYMHGENDNGVGKTVGGLSMLMGAANLTMKDVLANYDEGITVPFIGALYDWNMLYNPDQEIKGDFKIKAQGSTTLIAREIRIKQLDDYANTTNQEDQFLIDKRKLHQERLKARELPESILRPKEETDMLMTMDNQIKQLTAQIEQLMGVINKAQRAAGAAV